jgi:phenylacetate-CoA ligase
VVVTALNGFAMPLLRYTLGDTARLVPGRCACGSAFPLMELERGRNWDMIVLPSGNLVSPAVSQYVMRKHRWVDRFLLVQDDLERFRLFIVAQAKPAHGDLDEIHRRCTRFLEGPVELDIRLVDRIDEPADRAGSFVSRLPDWHETAQEAVRRHAAGPGV